MHSVVIVAGDNNIQNIGAVQRFLRQAHPNEDIRLHSGDDHLGIWMWNSNQSMHERVKLSYLSAQLGDMKSALQYANCIRRVEMDIHRL